MQTCKKALSLDNKCSIGFRKPRPALVFGTFKMALTYFELRTRFIFKKAVCQKVTTFPKYALSLLGNNGSKGER
jgi:hypothetical protein